MKKHVLAVIATLALVAAPHAWGAGQDPPGSGDNITGGDESKGHVGPLFAEFRDIPNTQSQTELSASRTLRVAARLQGANGCPVGDEIQVFAAEFACGDPLPPGIVDPCASYEVCTLSRNGRESCESETLLDFNAPSESYEAIAASLLAPQVAVGFCLESVPTSFKTEEAVRGRVVVGADGVKHAYVSQDIAILP
ncbi:MAG: hypothetical protein ACYTG6_15250 [Planctomycetota bacterium]|jgi:hypothetical protein